MRAPSPKRRNMGLRGYDDRAAILAAAAIEMQKVTEAHARGAARKPRQRRYLGSFEPVERVRRTS